MLKSKLPLVSIITPSFNSADYLEQAILSVLGGRYQCVEHLVMDGGSTDGTLNILKSYGSKVTWFSEPDQGQADALNKGFRLAQGEIVGWLNADDTYAPQAILEAVQFLQAHPEVELVYGHFNFIDDQGRIVYTHTVPRFSLPQLLFGNIIPNAGMFFRRELLDRVGHLNLKLHHVLDWEFVLRAALKCRIAQTTALWGNFRIVEGTKSVEKSDRFWPEIIPVLDRIASASPVLKPYRVQALYQAYLLAAVEFARAGRLSQTRDFLGQAFQVYDHQTLNPACSAVAIIETATRPWHRGFHPHPRARQTIATLAAVLRSSPAEWQVKVYLEAYLRASDPAQPWLRQQWLLATGLLQLQAQFGRQPCLSRLPPALLWGPARLVRLRSRINRLRLRLRRFNQ